MNKRSKPDSLSLALFADANADADRGAPGHSDIQRQATDVDKRMVLKNPMPAVALTPTRGLITRSMNLLWMKIIQEVQRQDEAATYRIPTKELVAFMQDDKNYDRLKANLKALVGVQVEWHNRTDGGEQWGVSTLLAQAKITRTGGTTTVEIGLPPDINTGVREHKQFSMLNLYLARELKNPAAVNLYRIAVGFETNPSRVTFRDAPELWEPRLRGVPRERDAVFTYKYFKRDTLLPAIAEVNRLTNLTVELIEYREGRSVKEIQFRITSKGEVDVDGAISDDLSRGDLEAIALMKEVGVRSAEARQLLAAFGHERVRRNVEYLKRKQQESSSKIRSAGAYLKAAIQGDYADNDVIEGEVTLVTSDHRTLKDQAADREMVLEQYKAQRRSAANEGFMEMTRRDSEAYWEKYMAWLRETKNQTLLSAAATKGIKAKIVQLSFYNWLADELQGPITEEGFTAFLVGQVAKPTAKRATKRRALSGRQA